MPERHKPTPVIAQIPWQVPVAVEDVAEDRPALRPRRRRDNPRRSGADRRAARFAAARSDFRRDASRPRRLAGRRPGAATVGQTCVVTLEPVANEVAEEVDLLFAPQTVRRCRQDGETAASTDARTTREPLIGGSIDLGALATEFLILGLDPYPRKPDAVFQPPQDATPDESPFAALAALKKGRDGRVIAVVSGRRTAILRRAHLPLFGPGA